MTKGRRPVPEEVKRLRGNPGKRPLIERSPRAGSGVPTCPDWLDDYARTEWRRVVPELAAAGLLTKLDRSVLAAYCATWSAYRQALEEVAREGQTGVSTFGNRIIDPAAHLVAQHRKALRELAAELGMSPRARGAIKVPAAQVAEDEFDAFLRIARDTAANG